MCKNKNNIYRENFIFEIILQNYFEQSLFLIFQNLKIILNAMLLFYM